MGLIKAAINAVGGTLADQWKEFFYCEAMSSDVLVQKGVKKGSERSSNTKGTDNVITQGSGIAVADGQCMIIVEQGKIIDVCAEPGEYTFNISGEPSIFAGDLGTSISETFASLGSRIAHGGMAGTDTRIYYFNTKEIIGNKYGTPTPVPFRVVDKNIGLDIDVSIRCNGEYSYKIVDPILFYTNVCGNVQSVYRRSEIDSMLKAELLTALQPAFAKISDMGIRYSAIPGHTMEIADALNEVLSKKWSELRGIKIASFGVNSVTCSPEDEQMIKELQRTAVMRDPSMAAATLVGAQGDAMKAAASNRAGAMTGFMGMGMAQQAGGMDAQALFNMAAQQQAQNRQAAPQQAAPADNGWKCSCGTVNTAKFCSECGSPKPSADGWKCSCGAVNKGKFCAECGSKKPVGEPLYRCDKCGWEPEDPKNPPKFCPECGDRFDENDIQ
ncbi:MAG: SPFH domain-containing protein [Oscillospiraceae bacterium]|nr:SPFH domain-containing protein [Oscillospiraceae bacterium]